MECLPFVKRIASLRTCMARESPGDFSKKVFISRGRKQRRSVGESSGSSVESEQTLTTDMSKSPSATSQSVSSPSIDSDSDRFSTSTAGYMAEPPAFWNHRRTDNSEQRSTICDESTVFSFSNQMDITVVLKGSEDFLGVSIVGQNYSDGESSLFVGAVIPGGAVSRDGRVQPGDLILAVNGEGLDGLSNKEAVAMLRQAVKLRREVTLTIIGSWDEGSEYSDGTCVQPIDPLQWLAHNSFLHKPDEEASSRSNEQPHQRYRNLRSQHSIASSSLSSSMPSTTARYRARVQQQAMPLETPTDIIANRLRLFIVARNNGRQATPATRNTISMNGVELQMWLYKNVRGFKDLAEVENYATHMINNSYLIPASTYLLPTHHSSTTQQFNRRENYIVNTRPATPAKRPLTPLTQSSYLSTRSSTPLSVCEEVPTDRLQLLRNQLSSTGLSVQRY